MEEQQAGGDEAALKVVEGGGGDDVESLENDEVVDAGQQQFIPPKVTMLRPSGINVQKFPDGSAQIELLISPFEVIGFGMPTEAVKALIHELTGGIEIARSIPRMDVPRGRGR